MFYEFAVAVPRNTASDDPVSVTAALVPGMVTHIAIEFPAASGEEVHASIRDGLHQVWPTNPDNSIVSDGWIVEWNEQYEVLKDPFHLQLVSWNDSAVTDFVLKYRFTLMGLSDVKLAKTRAGALDYLAQWFARSGVSQ